MRTGLRDTWPSIFRIVVGGFWLFFGSQKWMGVGWMKPLMVEAATASPIPGVHELLKVLVLPHWELFAIAQAVGETAVGVLLVLGMATRGAAVLGILLALTLCLTVAFLTSDGGFRWMYYLALLVNGQVAVSGPGRLALDSHHFTPRWLSLGAR